MKRDKRRARSGLGWKILIWGSALVLVVMIALYRGFVEKIDTTLLCAPAPGKLEVPAVRIAVDDGKTIAAVYWPPPDPGSFVILYNLGNLEQLCWALDMLREYRQHGYGVIGYDYEGFGTSDGTPSIAAACRDAEAIYRYLTGTCGIAPERIIVVGFSMGSGPACQLACRHPVAGLVLKAPLASVFQVVIPWDGWPGDQVTNARLLAECKVPVLIFHGTRDTVIPFRNSEKIHAVAAGRKRLELVPGADHCDLVATLGEENYFRILGEFFPPRR